MQGADNTSFVERQNLTMQHGDPPHDTVDECVFKEAGQPESRVCATLRVLPVIPDVTGMNFLVFDFGKR